MAELVYRPVIGLALTMFKAWDLKIDCQGSENIPRSGGAVLVSNHISYLDFIFNGFAALPQKRLVRFMAKRELFDHRWTGPLMRSLHHIEVDRGEGLASYHTAVDYLKAGEAVGIFPEAGVSTSYTVRALMPGAVALARETGAPLVPVALWGPQRILTASRPVDLHRGRPVSILVGTPRYVDPAADLREATAGLGACLQGMVDVLQRRPAHQPAPGEHAPWHPAHLGGSAPDAAHARTLESVPVSALAPSWLPGVHETSVG